jgi:hypothetical protein
MNQNKHSFCFYKTSFLGGGRLMDNKIEDTMVRQIEKNLSNNINENLFLTGRLYEDSKLPGKNNSAYDIPDKTTRVDSDENYPLVSYEYISNSDGISRAEYIRQAREACLRQLSATQLYSRPYDVNYMEPDTQSSELMINKKAKEMKLFRDEVALANHTEENTPQEIASFRSLIIRTVCAIVLFLSIFLLDKFEVKIGDFSHKIIQEYVTGKDALEVIQDKLVTWLK